LRVSTGVQVAPEFWNNEAQAMRTTHNRRAVPEAAAVNAQLRSFQSAVARGLESMVVQGGTPTPEGLKVALATTRNTTTPNKRTTPDGLLRQFNEYAEARASRVGSGRQGTIRSVRRHLEEFQKKEGRTLTAEGFTLQRYTKFLEHLYDAGLNPTTARTKVKVLTNFFRWLSDHRNIVVSTDRWELPKDRQPRIVALTEDELQRIEVVDLSHNRRLLAARDLFLIECYTGLRYGDAIELTIDNIRQDDEEIEVKMNKTRESVRIPIHPRLRTILRAYEYNPPKLPNQELNRLIKRVAALAGITDPVTIERFDGGKQIDDATIPKCEAITSHTGRRTFCTLSLLRGVPAEVVMKISGHKDYRTFRRYVEITDSVAQDAIRKAWG
jgi:integrase